MNVSIDHIMNFGAIMTRQTELKDLLICNYQITAEFLEILLSLPLLDDVLFKACHFRVTRSINVKNTSITKLDFCVCDDIEADIGFIEILKNYVNIKSLVYRSKKLSKDTLLSVAAYLKNLKELEITGMQLDLVKIETLEEITTEERNHEKLIEFLRINPQLKVVCIKEPLMDHPALKEFKDINNGLKVKLF